MSTQIDSFDVKSPFCTIWILLNIKVCMLFCMIHSNLSGTEWWLDVKWSHLYLINNWMMEINVILQLSHLFVPLEFNTVWKVFYCSVVSNQIWVVQDGDLMWFVQNELLLNNWCQHKLTHLTLSHRSVPPEFDWTSKFACSSAWSIRIWMVQSGDLMSNEVIFVWQIIEWSITTLSCNSVTILYHLNLIVFGRSSIVV